jgi:hypothetical protein
MRRHFTPVNAMIIAVNTDDRNLDDARDLLQEFISLNYESMLVVNRDRIAALNGDR